MATCARCHGDKILPHYMHIQDGICFQCQGTGIVHNYLKSEEFKDDLCKEMDSIEGHIKAQGDFEQFCKAHPGISHYHRIFNAYLIEHGYKVTVQSLAKKRVMGRR